MNGRHKKDPNKDLVVKGTGYVSPYKQNRPQPISLSRKPPISGMRRAGSVGNVASTSRRVPLVPQAPPRPSISYYDGESNGYNASQVICNCQHPASLEFLENVYVQNLQTQIEILELENSYLKSGSTATAANTTPSRPILREDTSSTLDRNIPRPDRGWASMPSTSSQYRKRVEFIEDHRKSPTKSPTKRPTRPDSSDEDALFEKLEESIQREHQLEERLKSIFGENERLLAEKQRLEERLDAVTDDVDKFEERLSKERRTLMEENVELQRRLDELTPLLAEKEAQIARLADEKEATSSKLRNVTLQLNTLQSTINELKREESFHSELETTRRQESERYSERIRQLEEDLEDQKQREINLL
uniref:Uncharacterized protein n=1 Tax=Acrobeloides nanus TaxID=290746 RepID=A0A914C0W5_9BILA